MASYGRMSLCKEDERSAKDLGEFRFSHLEDKKTTVSVSSICLLINLAKQIHISQLQCSKYCSKFFMNVVLILKQHPHYFLLLFLLPYSNRFQSSRYKYFRHNGNCINQDKQTTMINNIQISVAYHNKFMSHYDI